MRPKTKDFAAGAAHIPPLPLGKTVVEVLADFLKYLNDCARQYIQEVHPGIGSSLWAGSEIHYILSHPNGWEGSQQALMKQAAEKAGLVPPGGRNKLTFITEGEASLNRCIEKGLMTEGIRVSTRPPISSNAKIMFRKRGDGITIVDAGGGTLDISAYAARPDGKSFEEIAESQCELASSFHLLGF